MHSQRVSQLVLLTANVDVIVVFDDRVYEHIERDIVELVQLIYENNNKLFETEKDLFQLAFKNG